MRNTIFIKLEENISKISKRPKLDKIHNKYNINVVRCSLTKGKAGLRSALLYYKVQFFSSNQTNYMYWMYMYFIKRIIIIAIYASRHS